MEKTRATEGGKQPKAKLASALAAFVKACASVRDWRRVTVTTRLPACLPAVVGVHWLTRH